MSAYSTNSDQLVKLTVELNGRKFRALLDSGSSQNFISATAVRQAGLSTRKLRDSYGIRVITGKRLAEGTRVDTQTNPTFMEICGHQENIVLDVLRTAAHDVILGLPWLRKHNPIMDWSKGTLSLANCNCARNSKPAHPRNEMADERGAYNTTSHKARPERAADSLDTGWLPDQKKRVTEKSTPLEVPVQYQRYKTLFEDLEPELELPEHRPWDCVIDLKDETKLPFMPLRPRSEKELAAQREETDLRLAKGHIRKSKSPVAHETLFVEKKNGKLRMCIDYRPTNDNTIKNRYPLPNITELQDRLAKARIFTALDLRDGYHLIRMKKGEEWKTAFRTRYGHFEYTVMPFGLTNAPATFQALINDVLRERLDVTVIAYLDDILIYSENEENHEEHVHWVLRRLQEAKLRVRPEKCEFHTKRVKFLGFIIQPGTIEQDPEKIKVVAEWPTPENLKDVQSFMGFCNFNRRFIRDFSGLSLPLTRLTRKEQAFLWSKIEEAAFQALKEACISAPVLIMFQSGKPMRMETDASDLALGACITQEKDGKWHPVAYYSRKFSATEERYDVYDKELMAIVDAIQHWRIYCESCSDLAIYTDHKNLVTFTTTKDLNRRQVRWAEKLSQYKFRIIHTPGKDNGRADALSRRRDIAGEKTEVRQAILREGQDGTLEASHEVNTTMRIANTVPKEQQDAIIQQHHDDPLHGHPGIKRTMELIQRNYDFPGMKELVTRYIQACDQCQRNKHSTHAKYGEMQPTQIAKAPWEDIAMDFVSGFPESKDPVTNVRYNAILVIVDRFTKYALFIPFHKNYSAEQLGHIILDKLVRNYGIPKTIISDRDKLFTSNYWTTLMATIGTKRKLSTAYHPETDGQTERTNQTMLTYLRLYSNQNQDNWISLLPMAQLVYNNKLSESTGETPYFANHGRHPNLFERTFPTIKTQKALQNADELKEIHKKLEDNMRKAQQRSISYVNKKRKMAPQLKRGDKVYLLTKNLRTKRPSKKLDHIKVGPFLIDAVISPVNYRLQLPEDAKIHSVFHISLLEPADPETPLQNTFHYEEEETNEFEVEQVLRHRLVDNGKEYLIKWKDYPHSENTWEPENHLVSCRQKLRQYQREQQAVRKPPRSPKETPRRHPRY